MNKSLRQVFTAVVVLFVVLALSSSAISAVFADRLNADSRNSRALYQALGAPRGAILASDGTVLAQSDPVNDSFSYQRSYSNGPVYAPVTGFFSITHTADRGIEASRNEQLNGQASSMIWQQFRSLLTGSENQGASIETSIDTGLQTLAYQLLDGYEGSVVVSEPSTGRILAMVSTPSYDPNQLATHDGTQANDAYTQLATDESNPMLNRATSQLYPPGSTFKVIVAAAALESGDYDIDTEIPAGASYTLPGTETALTNATSAGDGTNGTMTLNDALTYSSNTAFAQLGVALGADTLREMAEKFGYGSPIRVDGTTATGTPTEAVASQFPGSLGDDRLALASIGQGDVLSTPLQNLLVAMAVANDGTIMQPTLVDRVRASDLSVIAETRPQTLTRVFGEDTADKLTQMMESVVTYDAPNLQIDGVSVAAKTGTAQIGENNEANDAWVIGFAPADDPQIAVSVVVHNVNTYGASAAGPIMNQIMREALQQ